MENKICHNCFILEKELQLEKVNHQHTIARYQEERRLLLEEFHQKISDIVKEKKDNVKKLKSKIKELEDRYESLLDSYNTDSIKF